MPNNHNFQAKKDAAATERCEKYISMRINKQICMFEGNINQQTIHLPELLYN